MGHRRYRKEEEYDQLLCETPLLAEPPADAQQSAFKVCMLFLSIQFLFLDFFTGVAHVDFFSPVYGVYGMFKKILAYFAISRVFAGIFQGMSSVFLRRGI